MDDTSFTFPAGTDKNTWEWLFDGAAVNAFFALILVVLSVVRPQTFSIRTISCQDHINKRLASYIQVSRE